MTLHGPKEPTRGFFAGVGAAPPVQKARVDVTNKLWLVRFLRGTWVVVVHSRLVYTATAKNGRDATPLQYMAHERFVDIGPTCVGSDSSRPSCVQRGPVHLRSRCSRMCVYSDQREKHELQQACAMRQPQRCTRRPCQLRVMGCGTAACVLWCSALKRSLQLHDRSIALTTQHMGQFPVTTRRPSEPEISPYHLADQTASAAALRSEQKQHGGRSLDLRAHTHDQQGRFAPASCVLIRW